MKTPISFELVAAGTYFYVLRVPLNQEIMLDTIIVTRVYFEHVLVAAEIIEFKLN